MKLLAYALLFLAAALTASVAPQEWKLVILLGGTLFVSVVFMITTAIEYLTSAVYETRCEK